jgi:hypothetical protein
MEGLALFKTATRALIRPRAVNASPAGMTLCKSVTPIRPAVNGAFVDQVRFSAQPALAKRFRLEILNIWSEDELMLQILPIC